jgi:hypothetical protein
MKNQNDLIVSAVAVVIGLIMCIVFYATKPDVQKPADPAQVDLAPPKLPTGNVVYGNGLEGGGGGSKLFGRR